MRGRTPRQDCTHATRAAPTPVAFFLTVRVGQSAKEECHVDVFSSPRPGEPPTLVKHLIRSMMPGARQLDG
ncbi:MAG: hypothetical protein H7Z38_17325 [Rubrivivax sp.]|nr:hypothetical protein [Pyrinomonadaceae bacterium]